MLPVLLLFLIPIGGGIPAGVLLAREHALAWPVTSLLYFISDVILAFLFEPLLRLFIALGRRYPPLARATAALKRGMDRTTAPYGGSGGPFTLILIAFGVDPMTGRTAAAAAGHGFIAGWTFAIAGDMLFFWLIMYSTLRLNSVIGDANVTMAIILAAMIFVPILVRRLKESFGRARLRP